MDFVIIHKAYDSTTEIFISVNVIDNNRYQLADCLRLIGIPFIEIL